MLCFFFPLKDFNTFCEPLFDAFFVILIIPVGIYIYVYRQRDTERHFKTFGHISSSILFITHLKKIFVTTCYCDIKAMIKKKQTGKYITNINNRIDK